MNSCKVIGEVQQVCDDTVTVLIIPDSACSGCGAKAVCGSSRQKLIKVPVNNPYEIGDKLSISVASSALVRITFLLYFLGILVAATISLLVMAVGNIDDIVTAFLFLGIIAVYIPVVSKLLAKKYAHKLNYKINNVSR